MFLQLLSVKWLDRGDLLLQVFDIALEVSGWLQPLLHVLVCLIKKASKRFEYTLKLAYLLKVVIESVSELVHLIYY